MAAKKKNASPAKNKLNDKIQNLAPDTEQSDGQFITTNHGVRINDDHNSLKAGDRGATLLEDFILREKITPEDQRKLFQESLSEVQGARS